MALAVIDCSGSTANTASAGTTGSAAGASFEVRMHRPATVGRRGRVVSAAVKHQHMQVRASGQVVRDTREDLSVHFRANERVVSIDSHGKPLGSEYTIEQLESDGANAVEVLIPPGQIVTVTRAPRASQAQLLIDGQPVSSPVRAALDAVLALAVGAATDDQIFGTPERQAAGARWPLHGDIAARDLAAASDIQATIAGETRVVQRTMFQATDCLEMHGEMNATVMLCTKPPTTSPPTTPTTPRWTRCTAR